MDTKIAGLLGASVALLTVEAAEAGMPAASPIAPLGASSYAELLNSVPNAVEALKADDAARAQELSGEVQLARLHHHHHHHHWRHHHHHHHHHHVRHHHHHHHHGRHHHHHHHHHHHR
jgi:hypothetical protein